MFIELLMSEIKVADIGVNNNSECVSAILVVIGKKLRILRKY